MLKNNQSNSITNYPQNLLCLMEGQWNTSSNNEWISTSSWKFKIFISIKKKVCLIKRDNIQVKLILLKMLLVAMLPVVTTNNRLIANMDWSTTTIIFQYNVKITVLQQIIEKKKHRKSVWNVGIVTTTIRPLPINTTSRTCIRKSQLLAGGTWKEKQIVYGCRFAQHFNSNITNVHQHSTAPHTDK